MSNSDLQGQITHNESARFKAKWLPCFIVWAALLLISITRFCVDRKFCVVFNLLVLAPSGLVWFLLHKYKRQYAPFAIYPLVLSQVVVTNLAVRE